MDASFRELLADESDASETMDPAQKERVRMRLEQALGLPPNGGPGGGSTAGSPSSSTGTGSAGKLLLVALAIAAGVTLRVVARPSPPADDVQEGRAAKVAVAAPPAASSEALTPSAASDANTPTLAVADLPNAAVADTASRTRAPARPAPATGEPSRGLAEERALIAAARGSLVSRRFEDAARLLREHETAFRDGQLVTEREALRVWWLEDTGQTEAASVRAKQFHDRYPNSVLRPAVEHRGL
jgi:hypothetical protein